MTFLGLEGQMVSGVISRIGVLESAKDYNRLTLPPLSITKRLLWYTVDCEIRR